MQEGEKTLIKVMYGVFRRFSRPERSNLNTKLTFVYSSFFLSEVRPKMI